MNKQLYIVQVDNAKLYPMHAEHYLQFGQFTIHSGGRGNGAVGGLYTEKQLKRIIGRYPEGVAKAIPVATGFTQTDADDNHEQALWMSCYEQAGVDNWCGRDEAIAIWRENGYGEGEDE